jgi:hypothetical protein
MSASFRILKGDVDDHDASSHYISINHHFLPFAFQHSASRGWKGAKEREKSSHCEERKLSNGKKSILMSALLEEAMNM